MSISTLCVLYSHLTLLSTSLFALDVMSLLFVMYTSFLLCLCQSDFTHSVTPPIHLLFQIIRKAAESSGEGPPESHGEGGVRHAVWRLHEPERHQGQRNV